MTKRGRPRKYVEGCEYAYKRNAFLMRWEGVSADNAKQNLKSVWRNRRKKALDYCLYELADRFAVCESLAYERDYDNPEVRAKRQAEMRAYNERKRAENPMWRRSDGTKKLGRPRLSDEERLLRVEQKKEYAREYARKRRVAGWKKPPPSEKSRQRNAEYQANRRRNDVVYQERERARNKLPHRRAVQKKYNLRWANRKNAEASMERALIMLDPNIQAAREQKKQETKKRQSQRKLTKHKERYRSDPSYRAKHIARSLQYYYRNLRSKSHVQS